MSEVLELLENRIYVEYRRFFEVAGSVSVPVDSDLWVLLEGLWGEWEELQGEAV